MLSQQNPKYITCLIWKKPKENSLFNITKSYKETWTCLTACKNYKHIKIKKDNGDKEIKKTMMTKKDTPGYEKGVFMDCV